MTRSLFRLALMGLAALLMLEISARAADFFKYGANPFAAYNRSVLEEKTPLGNLGKPGARFEKWKLNNVGLRGPDLQPKQPGEIRIAAMGASDTFGLYESEGKEWPAQLDALIRAQFPQHQVQVINGSFYGLKLPGSLLYFKERVSALEPDIVILYVSLLHHAFFIGDNAKGAGRLDRVEGPASGSTAFEWRLERKIKERLKAAIPPDWLKRWNVKRFREKVESIRRRGNVRMLETVDESLFQQTAADLEEFIQVVEKRGARLILTSRLNNVQEEWGLLNFQYLLPAVPAEVIPKILNGMNELTRKKALEHGLEFVDLADQLPIQPGWMVDHVHMTDAGSEQIARAVLPAAARAVREVISQQASTDGDPHAR